MKHCKGCSHPTICNTHGCGAEEARANKAKASEQSYKELKAQRDELLESLRTLDKAAMDVVWAQNHHDASVAVHWLGEAAKASHAAIAKSEGKEGGA